MKYRVVLDGRRYEVEVERGEAALTNECNEVQSTEDRDMQTQHTAGEPVKAPLPGTVIKLAVKQGERVERGQLLLLLEAMKMENDITAPRSGTVAEISVEQGMSVKTGDMLLTIS